MFTTKSSKSSKNKRTGGYILEWQIGVRLFGRTKPSKFFFEYSLPGIMVVLEVAVVFGVKEIVVKVVVVAGSKKILRFVRVLIQNFLAA